MKKPLIGITASMTWEKSQDEWAGYLRNYLSFDYVRAIEKAGGIPLMIPILKDLDNADDIIDSLDGVLFSGGSDISPISFGQEPESGLHLTNYWRDQSEIKLLERALAKHKPLLCICRGFQLVNLYFKGTIQQDLDSSKNTIKHDYSELPGLPAHTMKIDKDSLLFTLLQKEAILVNSHHHQILDQVASEFKVSGRASDDVVEAMEYQKEDQHILAVQFHPEMMLAHSDEMLPLFTWLIEQASRQEQP